MKGRIKARSNFDVMNYESSLAGVFRIIFWLVLISLLVRVVARLAIPLVVRHSSEQLRKTMENTHRNNQRSEGTVTVENKKSSLTSSAEKSEYVDFVEMKE